MRSPMVEAATYITNKSSFSDLMVLRSNAGFYIGTVYYPVEYGKIPYNPGTRDTGYFSSETEARRMLEWIEKSGDTRMLRMHP